MGSRFVFIIIVIIILISFLTLGPSKYATLLAGRSCFVQSVYIFYLLLQELAVYHFEVVVTIISSSKLACAMCWVSFYSLSSCEILIQL